MKLNCDAVFDRAQERLSGEYLFEETRRRIKESDKIIHDLSVGDVRLPIGKSVVGSTFRACAEMSSALTFRGYPPCAGYAFLRRAISREYLMLGAPVSEDQVIVTSGAKEALFYLSCIFSDVPAVLPSVSYPVYRDLSLIRSRKIVICDRWEEAKIGEPSLIYVCSPDNPTGKIKRKDELERIVASANESGSVIIFDAAYSAFVREGEGEAVKSIFEIESAQECAIEVGSFSKSSGFTGLRCGWIAIINDSVRSKLLRMLSVASNGVSYLSQRAALAALGDEGKRESGEMIAYYLENARIIRDSLVKCGASFSGGVDSPYIWLNTPAGISGREFFDILLDRFSLAVTPGEGFGDAGKDHVRLSCFCSRPDALFASEILPEALGYGTKY